MSTTDTEWSYIGDVNLKHGGVFFRDHGSHFDFVEIADLSSDCGAGDLFLIEEGITSHEYYTRAEIRDALTSCGGDNWREYYKLGRAGRRVTRERVAYALWSYGHKDIDSSVVLYDADNGSDCAHCGEPIVYRNGQWEHVDADDDGQYRACEKPTGNAEPKRPQPFTNGAESWPDMLADDWEDYADGEAGIRRYLSDKFGISSAEDGA